MSGIAAVVSWSDTVVEPELIARMLEAVPHRATDGCASLLVEQCALGFACHATTRREREAVQPLRDAQRDLCVVADARLDNRDELTEILQGRREHALTDPEILLLGYERWGSGLAERLVGDFAFVVWDNARREVYAARDPFGVRPFYFHADPARLALASEVGQICALPGVSWNLDDYTILDYLTHTYRHTRRTFFKDVSRLAPGHFLLAREGSVREIRYWRPPREELSLARPAEYHEEFRRLFEAAVAARLDSDHPIIVDLSGGLDSSAIACAADGIYRRDPEGRPPLRLISAVYPGLECDETPYIDAVVERVQFRSEKYDGRSWNPTDDGKLRFGHPAIAALAGAPEDGWHRLAQQAGARVRLRGVGAEDVLLENGMLRDLAAQGRWLTLFRQSALAARSSCSPQSYWLKQAVRSTAPESARRIYRRLRPRRPQTPEAPPEWLGPRLRAVWSDARVESNPPEAWTSHAQQWNWESLSDPHTCWTLDLLGYWDANLGVECRFPFLDVRLAHFVLAMPVRHRLLRIGRKEILRRAMADLLPKKVMTRPQGPSFDTTKPRHIPPNLARYRSLLTDGTWFSEPYLDRGEVGRLLQRIAADPARECETEVWGTLWNIVMLERWLRALESTGPAPRPRSPAAEVHCGAF